MNTVKLIVYGTLLSGERNHHFCRNSVKITPCTVIGTLYDTGCGFPAFQVKGNTTVKAELIEIPFEDWEAVDRLEGYPRLYDRQLYPAKSWKAIPGSTIASFILQKSQTERRFPAGCTL